VIGVGVAAVFATGDGPQAATSTSATTAATALRVDRVMPV
jgi:hypothetical protein